MSADNWAECPRCARRQLARLAKRESEVNAMYGVTSIAVFDQAREELAAEREEMQKRRPTFREDYEFYGAETGVVTIEYSGSCTECGLTLQFQDKRVIPGCDE